MPELAEINEVGEKKEPRPDARRAAHVGRACWTCWSYLHQASVNIIISNHEDHVKSMQIMKKYASSLSKGGAMAVPQFRITVPGTVAKTNNNQMMKDAWLVKFS